MGTIQLTKEEMQLINKRRKESRIIIKGLEDKYISIKTETSGMDSIALFKGKNKQELIRAVLAQNQLDILALYYRRYIEVYNLKRGEAKISEAELNFIKGIRYKNIYEEMNREELPVVFKFTDKGLFLELRNKAKTNIHNIELNTIQSIEFRKFLLGN